MGIVKPRTSFLIPITCSAHSIFLFKNVEEVVRDIERYGISAGNGVLTLMIVLYLPNVTKRLDALKHTTTHASIEIVLFLDLILSCIKEFNKLRGHELDVKGSTILY